MDWSVASWGGTGVCELVLTNGLVFWSTGRNGRPTFPLNPCMPGQIFHCLLSLLLVWWPAGSASREKRASEPYAWSTCRVIAVADYKFYRFIGRNSIYNTAAYIVSPMLYCEHPNPTSVVCSLKCFILNVVSSGCDKPLWVQCCTVNIQIPHQWFALSWPLKCFALGVVFSHWFDDS